MSHNKYAKNRLIKKYGAKCFIERLHINTEPRIYKSSRQYKRMKALTYHHIEEKHNGGDSSLENGALLSVENHEWFNKQDEETKKILNGLFQELKELKVEFVDDLELPFELQTKVVQFNERGQILDKQKTKSKGGDER